MMVTNFPIAFTFVRKLIQPIIHLKSENSRFSGTKTPQSFGTPRQTHSDRSRAATPAAFSPTNEVAMEEMRDHRFMDAELQRDSVIETKIIEPRDIV